MALSSQRELKALKTGSLPFTFFLMTFVHVERQNNCEPIKHQTVSGSSGTDDCPTLITLTELDKVDTNSVDKHTTGPEDILGIRVRHVTLAPAFLGGRVNDV